MTHARSPAGYKRFDERGAVIVARADLADAIMSAYRAAPRENPTLHGYASQFPGARGYAGRETAYALMLPYSSVPVVVRHNRHGGALRGLTGDLFLGATRAPKELDIALALTALGISTPPVVAYAVYAVAPGVARSDVVTEEIQRSADLGDILLRTEPDSAERRTAWRATARLLEQLASGGVRHHDLNVKNVLLRLEANAGHVAYLLDVDRVELDQGRLAALVGNSARLRRSVEKWRRLRGARVTEAELAALRRTATSTPSRRDPS
jgi:hypothetical protein